jgi:hypothetical protein
MLAQAELIRLCDRKQELLARSDALRANVRDGCSELRLVGRNWSARLGQLREPKMLLLIGAAAMGIILAGRRSRRLGLIAKVAAGWRLFSLVKPLWRGYRLATALGR